MFHTNRNCIRYCGHQQCSKDLEMYGEKFHDDLETCCGQSQCHNELERCCCNEPLHFDNNEFGTIIVPNDILKED